MPSPYSPKHLVIFVVLLVFLIAFIQVGAISIAFEKLGLSTNSGFLLLFSSLFGSAVNLPLFTIRSEQPLQQQLPPFLQGLLRPPARNSQRRTLIAVNVGGGLIPVAFSLYLLSMHPLSLIDAALSTAVIAVICHVFSQPIAGIGIGMPIFIAPVSAAIIALLMAPEQSAPLAYICGTLGVLIGADLTRLKDVRHLGTPMASIGGAGTFDGIFITGIVAVLLA